MIMRNRAMFYTKHALILFVFYFLTFRCPIALSQSQKEQRYTYYEFDGVTIFYKTQYVAVYRELLPQVFQMPDELLVMAYIIDFYKMDKATQPYLEAAVFLLAKYEGRPAWHCVTMPVTSDEARLGGIYFLGYPKIMGDITLKRSPLTYAGRLKLKGKTVMTITHDIKDHIITNKEKALFQKLKGIRQLNILNGKVFQPKFGAQGGQMTLLEIAEMFPEKFQLKVGKAKLFLDPEAAGEHSKKLANIFGIQPSDIVLAYYFKNKFVSRFAN